MYNIDFKSLQPYVIEAFTHVYGEEFREVVTDRVNKGIINLYHDVEGLKDYLSFIKICKQKEFAIQFLEKIGYDVSTYKKESYAESLDEEAEKLLEIYIGKSCGFSEDRNQKVPLCAFRNDNPTHPKELLENKLKLINYLLNPEPKITEENFEEFTKTDEYLIILEKINQLNAVYENVFMEYKIWEEQLFPYEDYIDTEEKRKQEILQKKTNELLVNIFPKLPVALQNILSNKSLKEQQDILFEKDLSVAPFPEFISPQTLNSLKSLRVGYINRHIIESCKLYLENLGIPIPNKEIFKCQRKEDIISVLEFLEQESIQKYILSKEVVCSIASLRNKLYEEGLKEYYTTREDFKMIMKKFGNNPDNIDFIYYHLANEVICITCGGGTNDQNEFASIMFYTIRRNGKGILFFQFMHENGHGIDKTEKGCGFELMEDYKENGRKNPYDSSLRIYEKFNETLNDIFTMEAVDFLHSQGIYLIEPKEFIILDTSNVNTTLIVKNLLQLLVKKFKRQIIKAKLNTNPEELIRYIGADNFEDLVDVVNKVDFLARNGLLLNLKQNIKDDLVEEYYKELERVDQIYLKIDEYYRSHFEEETSDLKR